MNTSNQRRIVLCTSIVCALTCALSATAADGGTLADRSALHAGLTGRMLSDEEMGDLSGRYTPPPGSTVIIQIGDDPATTYSQRNPATPGSATVAVGVGGTTVTGHASTSAGSSMGSVGRSVSFGRDVSISYGTRVGR